MKREQIGPTRRRATNVTLPEDLVDEARQLNVNISRACATGLAEAVGEAADRRWTTENADWINAHRAWVESNDLPLERYRLF